MSFLHKIQLEEIEKFTPKKRLSRESAGRVEQGFDPSWRFYIPFLLTCVFFVILLVRVFRLQIIEGNYNEFLAEGNSIRFSLVRAERGVIFDRKGEVVARNSPGFSVELNTSLCNKESPDARRVLDRGDSSCEGVVGKVAEILDEGLHPAKVTPCCGNDNVVDIERIKRQLREKYAQITIASGLGRDDIIRVESRLNDLVGVTTQVDPLRNYFHSEAFTHLVGFIGEDNKYEREGKSGIEAFYDRFLRGISGSRVIETNSSNTYYTQIAEKKPTAGKNVHLYLDRSLQAVAHEALKEAVEKKKATGGAVVASDPKTGGILALVSYPSFDSNTLSKGISSSEYELLLKDIRKPFFNRTISATYPPGSTFKMVTSLAALSSGVITPQTLVNCPSFISIGSFVYRDWFAGGRGPINVKQALQVSCDTFFYTVGGGYEGQKGAGIETLSDFAGKLGFGKISGIDIAGEVAGVFPTAEWKKELLGEQWYLGDTYITSIGQGYILATPLQVNNYVSFFANRGVVYRPRVVQAVDGVSAHDAGIERSVLYENYAYGSYIDAIVEGMKMVVEPGGTAYPFFDFALKHGGVRLAGKTGTAEFGNAVESGGAKTHAWFTVFGPFENPNIVLTVLLEGGGGGSDDAAPVARKILDEWFK